MSLCACGAEMGTGGCTQSWRHPTSISGYNWPPPPGFVPDYKSMIASVKLIAESQVSDADKVRRILEIVR